MRVEKGKDADSSWASICQFGSAIDPATTDRINFGYHGEEDGFDIIRRGPESDASTHFNSSGFIPAWFLQGGYYHIDPTATPKTIDLFFQHLNEGRRLAALGIYKIEGDRLEIRVARYQPMFEESTQRPKSFSIEPGSDDTLFVLERYRPLEDEKVIRSGYWVLASEIDDGKSVSEENIRGTHYHFGDGVVSIA